MSRLIYLSQSLLPSATANSIHVVNMCEALSQLFDDVVLLHAVKSHKRKEESVDVLFNYYGVKINYRTIEIPWFRVKGMAFFYAIIAFLRSWVELRREKTFIYTRCMYSAFLHSFFKSAPIIYETHSLPRTKLHNLIEYRIFRSNQVIKIVVITNSLRRTYSDKYVKELFLEKFFVSPDGAPSYLLESNISPLKPFSTKVPNVVYTGSLLPGKGVEMVVKVAQKMEHVNFTVVGGKDDEIAKFKDLNISNLYLAGHVSPKDAIGYQRGADILLLPNQPSVLTDGGRVDIGAWTSPLKLFEYMASGRPIIASDLEVIKEILADKVNSLLADSSDPDSWVRCIEQLLVDPSLADAISVKALQDFKDKYTWDSRAKQIIGSLI